MVKMMNTVFMHWRKAASHRKETVLYLLLLAFMATLYIHQTAINSICIGLVFIYSLFLNSFAEKWQLLKSRRAVQLMLLFFVLHIVSTFFSENKAQALDLLVRRLPLLLFPASIGLITISARLKQKLLTAFAVITTIVSVYCLVMAVRQYYQTGDAGYLYSNDLSKFVDKQSIYFATMVNIAIFCYGALLAQGRYTRPVKWLVYAAMVFLFAIMFLLASRMAMIAFVICTLSFAAYIVIRYRKLLTAAVIIAAVAAEFCVLSVCFPKSTGRFEELEHTGYNFQSEAPESNYNYEFTPDQWNGANIRLAVWNCGWQLAKQHLITGSHLGDRMDNLMQVYKYNHFQFGFKSKRNLHNTYLDVLVTFGLVGLVVFLLAYMVLPFISAVKTSDLLSCVILLAIGWQLLTESYLDRSVGCILLGFFVSVAEGWRSVKPAPAPAFSKAAAQAATYIPG
jgi:O-antigen ligase